MKISELIQKLTAAKEEHGDYDVSCWGIHDTFYSDIEIAFDEEEYYLEGMCVDCKEHSPKVIDMSYLNGVYKVSGEVPDPKGKEYYHGLQDDPNNSFFDIWRPAVEELKK